MTKNNEVLTNLHFHTVDGLYLQDNDVEHEDYVLLEDLQDWLDQNTQLISRDDILELAMTGGHARRNYSIYDKFIDAAYLLEKIEKPVPETAESTHVKTYEVIAKFTDGQNIRLEVQATSIKEAHQKASLVSYEISEIETQQEEK